MKLFIKKIVFFVFAFLVTALATTIITEKLSHRKLSKRGRGVVIDKNNRLDSIQGNKIILVGGSNVCYGINSKIIEDSLKMPVVDMAINANMGMQFYYEQIKHALKQGDIVIAIPEYAAYNGNDMMGDAGTYSLALLDNRNIAHLNFHQWLSFPLYMGDIIKTNVTTAFTTGNNKITNGRYQYSIYGDYIGHQDDTSLSCTFKNNKEYLIGNFDTSAYPNHSFIQLVKSFATFCESKKVKYIHMYPVYARGMYDPSVVSKIAKQLYPVQFTGTAETYLYGLDSLYDSPNHLLYNIKDERTFKLVKDIKGIILTKSK